METVISLQLLHTSQCDRLKENGARMPFSLVLNLVMGLHRVHLKISLPHSSKPLLLYPVQICISQLHLQPYSCYSDRPSFDGFNCLHQTEPLYVVCTCWSLTTSCCDIYIYRRYLSGYTEWSRSFYLRV